ncbi:hypothetical protein LQ954_14240 [Sphingomonas sp. IC-11]|uniref:hypothetical protein n=1 Tax=Sphingomonas sp. IC-11 TaxID=2898528 RepID=UPI001E327127|nr:hypothetical protein [Sphingomonas sp. IC-11]MCD2317304.1 hypothetical protein [Sphingomonas sp. IC-11]
MIDAPLSAQETDALPLSGFREVLEAVLRQIRQARLPIGKLRQRGDTRLLANLIEGLRLAERRGTEALAALADERPGAAVSHAVELCDVLRDGVLSRDNSDDLDRELQGDGAAGQSAALWSLTERHFEALQKSCGELAETIVAVSPGLDVKEAIVMSTTDDPVGRQFSDVSEIAAAVALLGGGSMGPGRTSGHRFDRVSDQMAATLDSIGLPHDGVQLPASSNPDAARARLIDALSRNFSSRDRDGNRVYQRTDPQPFSRDPYGSSQLLRGRGLVNANLLRAEADALLGILDRLPSMARFQLASPWTEGSVEREVIRRELDALVETARDPMGVNPPRAKFQLRRLNQAIGDYLDNAEIVEVDGTARSRLSDALANASGVEEQIDIMTSFRDDELCAPTSVVRDEEVRTELANLISLQESICKRLTASQSGAQLGVAAARLEELLTAALASADQLEAYLERSGTDIPEQDVQLEPKSDTGTVRLSIGQFIRWVRSVALAYAGAENRAVTLRRNQAQLLAGELDSLSKAAGRFAESRRLGLSRPLPRIQLLELAGYLASASEQANVLAGKQGSDSDD